MNFFFFLETNIDDFLIEIYVGTSCEIQNLTPIYQKLKNEKSKEMKVLFMMQRKKIKFIADKIVETKEKNLTQEEIDKMYQNFKEISRSYYEKRKEIFQIHPLKRQPLFEISSSLEDYFRVVHQLISSSYTKNISNDLIAQVNSLSYKENIRGRIQKKLEQRMKNSVPLLNDAYEKIKKFGKKLNETKTIEELEKEFQKENEEIGRCFLSCNNFVESIFENDCLCITFNVSRSDLCIVNPSSLKINTIFPTIISGVSFLDCVKYTLNISTKLSGGFDENSQGKIVKG